MPGQNRRRYNRGRRRSDTRRQLRNRPPRVDQRTLERLRNNACPADYERRRKAGRRLEILPRSTTTRSDAMRALNLVRRSGVAPYLEERLSSHPGPTSWPMLGLLVGLVISAWDKRAVWRTTVTAAIASLPEEMRFRLKLHDPDTFEAPSYRSVANQLKRIEEALGDGWTAADGTTCNLDWFTEQLLQASIPAAHLGRIGAVAIDGTAWDTFARPIYQILEADEEGGGKDGESEEPIVGYWRTLADTDGSLPEPTS